MVTVGGAVVVARMLQAGSAAGIQQQAAGDSQQGETLRTRLPDGIPAVWLLDLGGGAVNRFRRVPKGGEVSTRNPGHSPKGRRAKTCSRKDRRRKI